jgi:hypothetical protein
VYCRKINKSRLSRTLNVVTREGVFEVSYRNNLIMEKVFVDGRTVGSESNDMRSGKEWFRPSYTFNIGNFEAVLWLQVGWNLKILSFCLDVEGKSVYAEYARSAW